MKRVLKCAALVLAALVWCVALWNTAHSVAAATTEEQQRRTARRGGASVSPTAQAARAKTVFTQNCARCHGSDGRSDTALGKELEANDLTDPEWQKKVNDKRIMQSISRGRDAMPAFGKKLSREDIIALCAYVRSLKK
jgi:cbb3-type cytochrome c oxidase subunit III